MKRASPPEMTVPRPAAGGAVVTLAQTVTEQLRQALIDGRFVPDEKLHEESLSAMLKVSRTPVRAALHALAGEGLLDYVPNRGYSVRGLDVAQLGGIFDVRGVLEGLAARQAAERGLDEPRRQAMRAALGEGDRVIGKGRLLVADRAIFSDVNACIHDTLIDAAANRMLQDMVRQCLNIPVSSERNVLWNDYRWLRRSHDDHHRLFEAVCSRDGSRAEALMREHILSVKLQLVSQRS